jgi:hypothetical protein
MNVSFLSNHHASWIQGIIKAIISVQHIGTSWHIDMVSFFKSSCIKASKQTDTSTESYIVSRCSILLDVKMTKLTHYLTTAIPLAPFIYLQLLG